MSKKSVKGRCSLSFNIPDGILDVDHIMEIKPRDRAKEFDLSEPGHIQKALEQFQSMVIDQKTATRGRRGTRVQTNKKESESNKENAAKEKAKKENTTKGKKKKDTIATKLTSNPNDINSIDKENCVMEKSLKEENNDVKTHTGNSDETKPSRRRAKNENNTKNDANNENNRKNNAKNEDNAKNNAKKENNAKTNVKKGNNARNNAKNENNAKNNTKNENNAKNDAKNENNTKNNAKSGSNVNRSKKTVLKVKVPMPQKANNVTLRKKQTTEEVGKKNVSTEESTSKESLEDAQKSQPSCTIMELMELPEVENQSTSQNNTLNKLDSAIGLDEKEDNLSFEKTQKSNETTKESVNLEKVKEEKAKKPSEICKNKKSNGKIEKKTKTVHPTRREEHNYRYISRRRSLERQERVRRRVRRRERKMEECMEKFSRLVVKLVKDTTYLDEEGINSDSNSTDSNFSYTDSSDFSEEESSCCSCSSCSCCDSYDTDEYSEYTCASSSDSSFDD